ncbi:unnamed protein product [Closterium sp. Naga37s-1]|nr:unnamed protein product [Closterium sp. Naga37s-1]
MSAPEKPLVSEEEMANARLSLGARDLCAHLLIPLNRCRTETMFAPWKCSDERHSYENGMQVQAIPPSSRSRA